ncbi:unnamed protein product [Peronospora farinosa]|uniref:Uncharacterized protein n=1 Tax=Peronospora farinosa TaxID=134698 RepID=A0AAV0TUJ6_9STRA|nr:unnamed protein product [Peronospora farinosa]
MHQGWLFVGELYDSCMNSNSTNSTTADDASLKVLSSVLEQIAATKSKKKLFRLAGVLHKAGTSFSTELGVEVNAQKRRVRVVCSALNGDRVQQHRKFHSDWLGNKRLHRFSYRWMILSQLLEGRMLLKNLTDQTVCSKPPKWFAMNCPAHDTCPLARFFTEFFMLAMLLVNSRR